MTPTPEQAYEGWDRGDLESKCYELESALRESRERVVRAEEERDEISRRCYIRQEAATQEADRLRTALSEREHYLTVTLARAESAESSLNAMRAERDAGITMATSYIKSGRVDDALAVLAALAPSGTERKEEPCAECVEGWISQRVHEGAWTAKPCPKCAPPTERKDDLCECGYKRSEHGADAHFFPAPPTENAKEGA